MDNECRIIEAKNFLKLNGMLSLIGFAVISFEFESIEAITPRNDKRLIEANSNFYIISSFDKTLDKG